MSLMRDYNEESKYPLDPQFMMNSTRTLPDVEFDPNMAFSDSDTG